MVEIGGNKWVLVALPFKTHPVAICGPEAGPTCRHVLLKQAQTGPSPVVFVGIQRRALRIAAASEIGGHQDDNNHSQCGDPLGSQHAGTLTYEITCCSPGTALLGPQSWSSACAE